MGKKCIMQNILAFIITLSAKAVAKYCDEYLPDKPNTP